MTLTPFYLLSRRPMYCKTTASKMIAAYDAFLVSGLPDNRGVKECRTRLGEHLEFLHVLSESEGQTVRGPEAIS